jgi:hypothetical protein
VLEHVELDSALILAAHRALEPGGALLLFVPALPHLFGSLDEAFGHYRRYTKSSLRALLCDGGFDVIRLRYVNSIGVLSWLLTGRALRQRSISRSAIRFYDRGVIPWLAALEERWEPPIGQSIVAIARKNGKGGLK